MPLFSRKDRPNKFENKSSDRKNTVMVQCPECGFEQREPLMAVSTYCRSCSAHYKIEDGKAVPKKERPSNPFVSLRQPNTTPRIRTTDQSAITPSDSDTINTDAAITAPRPQVASSSSEPRKKESSKIAPSLPKSELRSVACFECSHVHTAPLEASSTLCPACGAYIGLKNYDIRDNWNRRIQTRGNVTIHKKATVTGITIQCHHLTAQGNLTGGVDCSGDFTIQSHGKIMGKVRCKRLIIEKKARVDFSNPVECEDAIIDGAVTGNFTCKGRLHLKKKATLNGDIKVATMAVDEGARHQGRISIGR